MIRQAAGVVFRKSAESNAVFLVHRSPKLRFFGDYWAFPGGKVGSEETELARRVEGGAAKLAPFVAAAFREMLEETGIFLAEPVPPLAERDSLRRALVAADETAPAGDASSPRPSVPDALEQFGARIPGDRFHPMLRLLTPAYHPIRFDTQFLVVDMSEWTHLGAPDVWPGELVEGEWADPALWLQRWRTGDVQIAPPVLLILRILAEDGWVASTARFDALAQGLRERIHPIFYNAAVQLIPLETPTLPPATHTNAYLIGCDPAYLIDPATPHPSEQARLCEALNEACGGEARDAIRGESPAFAPPRRSLLPQRRLEAVLLTHHHPDHVGAVERVRERYGLPVLAHARTAELLAGTVRVDRTIEDGDRLPLGASPDGRDGWELEVLHTPGHAEGHLCFFERRYGSLIAGDMISTLSSILIHPDDGDMVEYLDSLERLCALPTRLVFPAHGPAVAGANRVLSAQLAHRRTREESILQAIRDGAGSPRAVVERVYGDVPPEMHGHAELSVRSVCRKLGREGKIGWDEPAGRIEAR